MKTNDELGRRARDLVYQFKQGTGLYSLASFTTWLPELEPGAVRRAQLCAVAVAEQLVTLEREGVKL